MKFKDIDVEEGHKTTVNKTLNKIEQHEYHLKQSALETRLSNMSTTKNRVL
jgi:hypothetical protein